LLVPPGASVNVKDGHRFIVFEGLEVDLNHDIAGRGNR
jgi:hypothetical protein